MKKYLFILTILLISMFFVIILINKDRNHANPHLTVNGIDFEVEIAKTKAQKEKGLAKYNKISDTFAMVFPFEKTGFYAFWMKDMKFSIDIIYVNKNKIVQIFKNVPYPKSSKQSLTIYRPSVAIDTVLEINGNLSQKYNFKKGDNVEIEY